MFELIPSKEYRKFIENKGIVLSDWDKATLIYNHRIATHDEKMVALQEIKRSTFDELLKEQIEERVSRDKLYFEKFKQNNGNAFYSLSTLYEGKYDVDDYYLDFDSAFEDGMKEGTPFKIKKELFECKKKTGNKDGIFGGVGFDAEGLKNEIFWLYSETEDEVIERVDNRRFEYRYLDIPLMFREKDVVHVIGTELYGIVDAPINDEDELKYRNCAKSGDYSDWQVTVNKIYDGQRFLFVFSHDHIAPADLELAEFEEGDVRKGMMEYMVKTLYANSLFDGGGRDAGRIATMLSAIEMV